MELLLSNYPPAKFSKNSFISFFERNINETDILQIASGYISTEALTELKRIVEIYGKPFIRLMIGMHKFDGFTKPQYEAATILNDYLKANSLGGVYISTTYKFHGKMYSFGKNQNTFAAVVGSSNLGSFFNPIERQYEADCLFTEKSFVTEIDETISKIIKSTSIDLAELKSVRINEYNSLLENHLGVKSITQNEMNKFINGNSVSFEIALRSTPKSNLNIYFGKGRDDKKGRIKPRAWYEAEIIVPKNITTDPYYPSNKTFTVVTDDLWEFKCNTNGDNYKNFRSKENLQILGKWIKGRLEKSHALKVGMPVTDEVLNKYGRNSFSLISTNDPDVWVLDFKAHN